MPNRFLFGVAFDRPGSRGKAFYFQNKKSPSIERGRAGRLRLCDLDVCLKTDDVFGNTQYAGIYPRLLVPGGCLLAFLPGINSLDFLSAAVRYPISGVLSLMNCQINVKIGNLFMEKTTRNSKKSTSVENLLQIRPFLTNKPNSPIVQIHLTIFNTMNYINFTSLTKVKNKPNSNPIKPKKNQLWKGQKMNVNIYSKKAYNYFPAYRTKKTNPKQTQFLFFPVAKSYKRALYSENTET